jgi:hypothetical protein
MNFQLSIYCNTFSSSVVIKLSWNFFFGYYFQKNPYMKVTTLIGYSNTQNNQLATYFAIIYHFLLLLLYMWFHNFSNQILCIFFQSRSTNIWIFFHLTCANIYSCSSSPLFALTQQSKGFIKGGVLTSVVWFFFLKRAFSLKSNSFFVFWMKPFGFVFEPNFLI